MAKAYLAFLWHFHQPFYKDLLNNSILMPWVRLHGIKDYYGMAKLLEEFPNIKCTANFSPALLTQLKNYVEGKAFDTGFLLARSDTAKMTEQEGQFILENSFLVNFKNMIEPSPRYTELYKKRQRQGKFTTQELRDLLVWNNLAWFHPLIAEASQQLEELRRKDRNFSEEDKEWLLKYQLEILSQIIPLWRSLLSRNQVEITFSPFYHPILPLLNAEDCNTQVAKAKEFYSSVFGGALRGMWPSEGSVSKEIIPVLETNGIRWIATDEEILGASLGVDIGANRNMLYKPHCLSENVAIIFRDKELSNLIGFSYKNMSPKSAAKDLISRIEQIALRSKSPLVSIILDGENAWEYYENNGIDFLRQLYALLNDSDIVETVSISEYLERNPPDTKIQNLYAGSWINHDFHIWNGHAEDKKGWELVGKARNELIASDLEKKQTLAWESLYAAEGSDWFWWFGEDFSSALDMEFDMIFRKHLMNVYAFMGKPIPDELYKPIKKIRSKVGFTEPTNMLNVQVDGKVTDYFEWLGAGHYSPRGEFVAMASGEEGPVTDIYFGFDRSNFFIRIDFADDAKVRMKDAIVKIHFAPDKVIELNKLDNYAVEDIMEASLSLADIGLKPEEEVEFFIEITQAGIIRRMPFGFPLKFIFAIKRYDELNW